MIIFFKKTRLAVGRFKWQPTSKFWLTHWDWDFWTQACQYAKCKHRIIDMRKQGRLSDLGWCWQEREANDELAIRDAIAKPVKAFPFSWRANILLKMPHITVMGHKIFHLVLKCVLSYICGHKTRGHGAASIKTYWWKTSSESINVKLLTIIWPSHDPYVTITAPLSSRPCFLKV